MSVASSMVHRSGAAAATTAAGGGGNLAVRNVVVVSGDDAFHDADGEDADGQQQQQRPASGNSSSGKDLPDCKVRRNYTCQFCEFFTQNPRLFLYHLRDVHRQRIRVYECPNCVYASKHFQKLLRHSKMVHGTSDGVSAAETLKKSRRLSATDDEESQQQHSPDEEDEEMLPEDPDRPRVFKCSVCSFASRNRVQLNKHEREEHIKTKFFRCSKCTYVTHIKARYTKHVKYHSMPMIKCDMCDFRTPYKWNLDRHCKNHNGKGAFRCSACNFTADIKQSLTVHEMNHHVPPVGQASGLGVGRRRNKVGASDTTAAEEAAAANSPEAYQVVQKLEPVPELIIKEEEPPARTPSRPKIKITPKKSKVSPSASTNGGGAVTNSEQSSQGKLSDFIHPDDFIQHANGKVYIKIKCKLCNFKTAWDSEMAKHERHFHNIDREVTDKITSVKKTPKPIPNLIPISSQSVLKFARVLSEPREPMMSQKDINDICSRSANSALKDFAFVCGSEDVFKNPSTSKVPDLIPTSIFSSAKRTMDFKQKNASFFDQLKEKLELGTGCNLICDLCGHESKCLTEQAKHQKICGKEINKVPSIIPVHNISASRCQYCRQRCKSSADLYNHLQTCSEALKFHQQEDDTSSEHENELKIDEDRHSLSEDYEKKPHPMENKVFVWNDIMVPMDIDVDDSNYEYTEDKVDDNVSLDLSIRTHSPVCSESSYTENNNNININNNLPTSVQHSPVPEKIPTHGNDISVAQHKRVFKCPHCTFWASTASRFHVHIVGHLNKKPFECSLCSYRSNWRWDITKHIKLKSVRDQAHESAKVLMTDETGRRNYTKYNKYLTEIPLSSLQSSNETSGGSGTRPKNHDRNSPSTSGKLDKANKIPTSGDLNSLLKVSNIRGLPTHKAMVEKQFMASVTQEKKRSNSDSKKTLYKCKKCNFRDESREILLQHVKGHYEQPSTDLQQEQQLFQQAVAAAQVTVTPTPLSLLTGVGVAATGSPSFSARDLSLRGTSPDRDEASVNNSPATKGGSPSTTTAPFRCGHCNQVSNWKHVIQRHCRLKHSGDIRVVSTKNGQEKIEIEEQVDEPDDVDAVQSGAFKCDTCPYSCDDQDDFQRHLDHHLPGDYSFRCAYCSYGVSVEKEHWAHMKLHRNAAAPSDPDDKKFRCALCPYVSNSKSQYTYHKQFHKSRGGQYTCSHCSYNVSKRHLLHQHLKVHGISVSPSKQSGETIDAGDVGEDIIEEVPFNLDSSQFSDIPLVWVSKNGKFSKMFKCRYCPHVNLRKVNIQEHEKMHSIREKNINSTKSNEVEHRCNECNYVCNNAGVLSSHSKVHQGYYGMVHCLVDSTKDEEEQIQELTKALGSAIESIDTSEFLEVEMEEMDATEEKVLYFCKDCPARFLKENEFSIHRNFHNSDLQHKCEFCTYAADNESYLLSHLKVHHEVYQERTNILKSCHTTSPKHPEPTLKQTRASNGDVIWEVIREQKINILASFLNKPLKSTVPLSGTDLFQQRSEAQQRQIVEQENDNDTKTTKSKPTNVQFGELMHGNPDFIYQTYIKNGRTKEKRYKCHKCPSAFEKREQYKVHLGLHGSQQRYNCESCDYSVKYYANYAQHLKKHKFNDDAQAARKSADDLDNDNEINESMEVTSVEECDNDDVPAQMSVADQQMSDIVQQRASVSTEDKKPFQCPHCPYVNGRRDALDSHLRRHECESKVKSSYACDHCDYSVPQAHFLREHMKLHFIPNNKNNLNGYMLCDNLKLTSSNVDEASLDDDVIYEEPLDGEKFNNNKGEKCLINVQTGDLAFKEDVTSDLNRVEITNNLRMEVN